MRYGLSVIQVNLSVCGVKSHAHYDVNEPCVMFIVNCLQTTRPLTGNSRGQRPSQVPVSDVS